MEPAYGMVLCLAYIVGLLSTGVWWGGFIVLAVGVGCAVGIPRRWRMAPRARIWLLAGVVGLLASFYFQLRVPQPSIADISRLIPNGEKPSLAVHVTGEVESLPRLTRSNKAQFWLDVRQVEPGNSSQPVGGKLYVTVPLAQGIDLHPGQRVEVAGSLYKPQPATNPGAFDFQKYLQQEGCFAGLRGRQVTVPKQPTRWGWWMVQRRIVRSQARWLGSPAGPLVSSMVLGSRGVDLPFGLKDKFTQVGLAHALAASGFQTSLILGVVLALTRHCSARFQFILGLLSLLIFVGLTGAQPAVLRAALMGFGGLVALLLQRKIKPLGSLLVAGTLLLIWNPLWIWNLGFQFSFLATMGLLVTVPPLTKALDWLPRAVTPLLAVPIAAYLWTLPLQLFVFGVLSPYSILVNLVTTPLISLLSLGGMASALAALVWSPAGSGLAWLLQYPAQALIAVVDWCAQLPGNAYAVGTITAGTAIALYLVIGLTWLTRWWRRRWWLACLLAVGMVIVPVWQARLSLFQVTLLATAGEPVMVIQDGGRTALINSGSESTAHFSVLPFLKTVGVNEIDWALLTDSQAGGWKKIMEKLPIKALYTIPGEATPPLLAGNKQVSLPMSLHQPVNRGLSQVKLLDTQPLVLELQLQKQTWLILNNPNPNQQRRLLETGAVSRAQVLWWSGQALLPELIGAIQPKVAIASAQRVHKPTAEQLQGQRIKLYRTGEDGAVQWTSRQGFTTQLEQAIGLRSES